VVRRGRRAAGDVNGDGYADFIAAGAADARLFFGARRAHPTAAWIRPNPDMATFRSVAASAT